jgi:uncharacterized protein (DUF433 family)
MTDPKERGSAPATRDQIAACLDYARDLAEFAVEA